MSSEVFNGAAEEFYRNPLRLRHLAEALDIMEEDLSLLTSPSSPHNATVGRLLYGLVSGEALAYVRGVREAVMTETIPASELRKLICTVLLAISADLYRVPEPEVFFKETGT